MEKFIGQLKEAVKKCTKMIKMPLQSIMIGGAIMTKDEAMKILNLKENEINEESIMKQSKEYIQLNDPLKGGSFYIQNKVYHARQELLKLYQSENNIEKSTRTNKLLNKEKTNNKFENIKNKI